jgi:hypothetical protein
MHATYDFLRLDDDVLGVGGVGLAPLGHVLAAGSQMHHHTGDGKLPQ